MAHQKAQKRARSRATLVARGAALREALQHSLPLRREAERLLAAVPRTCSDLLAWSPEGYNVALVASVLADEQRRHIAVHRASLIAPLAPRLRTDAWTWVSVEELLGFGPPRSWAIAWAESRGGMAHMDSSAGLVLAS